MTFINILPLFTYIFKSKISTQNINPLGPFSESRIYTSKLVLEMQFITLFNLVIFTFLNKKKNEKDAKNEGKELVKLRKDACVIPAKSK